MNSTSYELALADLQQSMAFTWSILCAFLTVSMQLGFAMLEVGSVRQAHRMTVLVKNVMDSVVSCVCFWAHLHVSDWLVRDRAGVMRFHIKLSQWAFCASSVTICSGSMAERTHVLSYLFFAACMSGIIYPVVAASVWTKHGLLQSEFHDRFHTGYNHHDFAGGGVVHLTGGCAAFVGAAFVGRRIMRPGMKLNVASSSVAAAVGMQLGGHKRKPAESATFKDLEEMDEHSANMVRPFGGWQRRFDNVDDDVSEFKACGYLQVMGMFTLWVGWYGFNAGSTKCMDKDCSIAAGIVAWNTTLSGCAGGLGAYIYSYCVHRHLNSGFLVNGVLGGLVAITASCDVASDVSSLVIGLLSGLFVYPLASNLLQHFLVDDPVDAIPVHFFCGFFGVLVVAFVHPDCDALMKGGMPEQRRFCKEDFSIVKQLCAQLWGMFTEIWWTASLTAVLWSVFATSETVRAMEVKTFEQADKLLERMVTGTPSADTQNQITEQWKEVANGSPAARRILKIHGWKGSGFPANSPHDVYLMRSQLRGARGEKAETALEIANWYPLQCLARSLHSCRVFREISIFRLRISPVSEINGIGAADLDGSGQLFNIMNKAVVLLSEAQKEHSPLKHEVRELALAVQSQESVLNAMMRKNGRSSGSGSRFWRKPPHSPRVPTVMEQDVETDSPPDGTLAVCSPPAPTRVPQPPSDRSPRSNSPRRQGQTTPRGPVLFGGMPVQRSHSSFSASASTDRTVSDRSAGALTPRSAGDDTPPPSVIGRMHQLQVDPGVNEVAAQLMQMLSAQQALMQGLQGLSSPSHGGGNTPSTPSGAQRQPPWHNNHALISALQHVAASQRQERVDRESGNYQSLSVGSVLSGTASSASDSTR